MPTPTPEPQPTPAPAPETPDPGPGTVFEPVEDGKGTKEEEIVEIPYTGEPTSSESTEEDYVEIPYTASLKSLLQEFKASILYDSTRLVAEDENKSMKM